MPESATFFVRHNAEVAQFLVATMDVLYDIAHLSRCRSVGRCAIFGFVLIGHKNHMHIAHLSLVRVKGRRTSSC